MAHSWRKIGPSTVECDGEVMAFSSLEGALHAFRWHLNGAYLDFRSNNLDGEAVALLAGSHRYPYFAIPIVFRDELGAPIPICMLLQAFAELIGYKSSHQRYVERKRLRYGPMPAFRSGPVPKTGRTTHSSYYRSPGTKQERTRYDADRRDFELVDLGVNPRPSRGVTNLPSNYDDIPKSRRGRTWKSHRKAQWRTCG